MREIEVKAKLIDKSKVLENLKSIGCVFEDEITQVDTVYVKEVGNLETFLSNSHFLRIRIKNNEKIIFTLKTNKDQKTKGGLDKIEHEVIVDSKVEFESILAILGYKPQITTSKTRLETHYRDFEICVDEIKDLGSFIEVERIVDDGDGEAIQQGMFEFLESIGVNKEDRVFEGYDILMMKSHIL